MQSGPSRALRSLTQSVSRQCDRRYFFSHRSHASPNKARRPITSHGRTQTSVPRRAPNTLHTFTTCIPLHKTGGKPHKAHEPPSTNDPFDFSDLEAGIAKSLGKLKEDLSALRAGGRFNPDAVDALRVQLGKGTKGTTRLGDLAQVVPKGRVLNVMVGEKDHVKPVSSAILTSNLSLNPQPDPENPLQLNVNMPPVTAESRQQAVQAAAKAGEAASTGVRNARGSAHKRLRAMQVARTVRPDDLKRAEKEMEKVAEKGLADAKKIVDGARKVLESG